MCFEVEAWNFTTLVYSVLLNNGKSVLKIMKTLWKNGLTITKDVRIIHINFTVTEITFPEKKLEVLLSYHTSLIHRIMRI
jgi:hypothetical protein